MELIDFLVKAKVATYASKGESGETQLDDGCKELVFEEGDFKYIDRYEGSKSFFGKEVVLKNGQKVWQMKYQGGVIDDVSPNEVYNFLKKALKLVSRDRPYRGPENFVEGNFDYVDKSEGDVNDFSGEEKIFFEGREIYKLTYSGGKIKE